MHSVFNIDFIGNISYYRLTKDYCFPGESHESWELLYIDRGSLIVTAGTDTYFMKAGELVFHCPNEFHAFQCVGEADIVVITLRCNSPAMHKLKKKVLLLHRKEKEHLKMLIDEAQQVYRSFDNIAPRVNNLDKKEDAPWGSDQLIKTYLEQLFIHICRRDDNTEFSQRALSDNPTAHGMVQAQRIKDYLAEHYRDKITLESLSATMGVSVSQIKRIFREYIGQNMVSYVTDLRISQAKRLIREGKLNFTQVAEKVGYDSIYYFSALFKKHTGKTLSEYARSLMD